MRKTNKQPKWDIYESAMLIETYLQCKDLNSKEQLFYQQELSDKLRHIAENNGLKIDENFRNLNCIVVKMETIKSLFASYGNFKSKNTIIKVYKIYLRDKATFYAILAKAYLMLENDFDFSEIDERYEHNSLFDENEDENMKGQLIITKKK